MFWRSEANFKSTCLSAEETSKNNHEETVPQQIPGLTYKAEATSSQCEAPLYVIDLQGQLPTKVRKVPSYTRCPMLATGWALGMNDIPQALAVDVPERAELAKLVMAVMPEIEAKEEAMAPLQMTQQEQTVISIPLPGDLMASLLHPVYDLGHLPVKKQP